MSRLAKKPITLPEGVTFSLDENSYKVTGKNGTIENTFLNKFVDIRVEDKNIFVDAKGNTSAFKAYQGLFWSLIRNAVKGVSEGFSKTLEIKGVGYRWEIKGNKLVCNVGFSHLVEFPIDERVKLTQPNPALVTVTGCDKEIVGQVAANIRFIKPPEPYKGKGICYQGEVIHLKEGKAGKK